MLDNTLQELYPDEFPTGVILLQEVERSPLNFSITFMNQSAKEFFAINDEDYTRLSFRKTVSNSIWETLEPNWGAVYDPAKPDFILRKVLLDDKEFLIYLTLIEGGNLILIHRAEDHVKETLRLRNIARKYRSIFENSQDVFYQTSIEGEILEISPSVKKYVGFNRHEMIGKKVFDFYVDPNDRKDLRKLLEKNGYVYDYELQFRTKSGSEIFVSTNAHLVKDSSGTYRIEGALRNITKRKVAELELKKSNQQLQQLNVQKNKLFSVISHDLKNAMAGPSGLLELIIEDFEDLSKDEIFEYLKVMNSSTKNAMELLFDLLSWAKNQFQEADPFFTDVELQRNTEEIIKQQQQIASDKGVSIVNNLQDACVIEADENMINTVLRNLLSNAIKFSHPGGDVIIEGKKLGQEVQLSVKDSGVGMDRKTLDKIFDKTTNFTTKGTHGEKGSGLGLDLCIDFIKKHKGKIWAESEPDEGSTFHILLPLKQK